MADLFDFVLRNYVLNSIGVVATLEGSGVIVDWPAVQMVLFGKTNPMQRAPTRLVSFSHVIL